jgi:LPXTG-motif cell wall-anchored protein
MDTQSWLVFAVAAILVLIGLAAWFFFRKRQSQRLQQRFGPEYGRTVKELGSQIKAEADLKAREKRVERLHILPLSPTDAARFSEAWNGLQARFVDNPKGVVFEADKLVRELMLKRGYPMGNFERRAADLSVDHAVVVDHYRAAQAIAVRDGRGEADTEELRQAVVHYRVLFNELLEVREAKREAAQPAQMEAKS